MLLTIRITTAAALEEWCNHQHGPYGRSVVSLEEKVHGRRLRCEFIMNSITKLQFHYKPWQSGRRWLHLEQVC